MIETFCFKFNVDAKKLQHVPFITTWLIFGSDRTLKKFPPTSINLYFQEVDFLF